MQRTPLDTKVLIREAYRIEGIGSAECRSIFLDWALSVPDGMDPRGAIDALLEQYGPDNPDHPMTGVLQQGQVSMQGPKRRGGWRARSRN